MLIADEMYRFTCCGGHLPRDSHYDMMFEQFLDSDMYLFGGNREGEPFLCPLCVQAHPYAKRTVLFTLKVRSDGVPHTRRNPGVKWTRPK